MDRLGSRKIIGFGNLTIARTKTNEKRQTMSNIVLIIGLSASGKTTLANSPEFKNHIKISLDYFTQCHKFANLEEVKERAGQVIFNYFSQKPWLFKDIKNRTISTSKFANEKRAFINYALDYCENDKDNNYIIEGILIYHFLEIDYNKDYQYIILKKPVLLCMLRKIKRDLKQGVTLKEMRIFNLFSRYLDERKVFKQFCKELNRPLNIRYIY